MVFYKNQTTDTTTNLDNEIHNSVIDFIDNMASILLEYAINQGHSDVDLSYCKKLC